MQVGTYLSTKHQFTLTYLNNRVKYRHDACYYELVFGLGATSLLIGSSFAKMHVSEYAVLITIALFSGINCAKSSLKSEEKCLDYYQKGVNFDLSALQGEMNAVYFWPPPQRQRDSCEMIRFKSLSANELANYSAECNSLNVSDQTAVRATYKNSAGKIVNVLYFGNEETKSMYRSCDRDVSRYLFLEVNKDYVLGINCSAGGRGVLLSRSLPRKAELQAVVDGIEIMTGREGSPDCPLI